MQAPFSRCRFQLCAALAIGIAIATSASAASAADLLQPTYAVLSLVGDEFSVVTRRAETGTRIDPNDRRSFPITDATFDSIATNAAEQALKRARPVAPVLIFSIRDPRLFELQERLLVESAESHGLREALAKLLRDNQASQLIVITKRRDDAQFELRSTRVGGGKLSGLGFYIDPYIPLTRFETGEIDNGFLAPFAYVSVTIVDVASMRVVRSVPARESLIRLSIDAKGALRAWDALSPEAKVDALDQVLRRAVDKATTAAVAD